MKKNLLCLVTLLFLSASQAQNFCPPGATWHFARNTGLSAYTDGFVKLVYTGDAIINGINCKTINGSYTGRYSYQLSSPVTYNPNYRTYYAYESNHVIYLYNGSTFDTVVDFNARIGDKWLRPRASATETCNPRRAFTVTDTNHVTINGLNLKKVVTTYTSSYAVSSNTYAVNQQNSFIERAFTQSGGLFSDLFPLYCERDDLVADGYSFKFKCYEDNTFVLYNADNSTACESITGINSLSNNVSGISLYPMPAGDQLNIDLPAGHAFTYRITDLPGKIIPVSGFETESKMQLDLSRLDKGIYILQLFEKGQLAGSEKIIKN